MRFGRPDSDDEGYSSADYYSSSSYDSSHSIKGRTVPRSALGRTIHACLDDESDTEEGEINSEDEVELIGASDDDFIKVKRKDPWQEMKARIRAETPIAESSKGPFIRARSSILKHKDEKGEESSAYDSWRRQTEEQAMRDGHRLANLRQGEFRQIASNARMQFRVIEDAKMAREEEEMRVLLEAMAIKQNRDEEEVKNRFAEREKQLWRDIEAAIEEVERKEAELKAAAIAAIKKKQEEEVARAAKAEKDAAARKVEAERLAKEHVERQNKEREEAIEREKKAAEDKVAREDNEKKAREKGRVGSEWRVWVDRQKWMKKEVIEPVKADRGVKMGLRPGMRLITRSLGQVVNTRESVLRVTSDLHTIFCGQLQAEPSASDRIVLSDQISKPYTYLLSHTSKALIKQAETEVAAKADAAFPLARIVIGLLLRGHAAFGEILFARFVKKCPLVVPFFPSRQDDQPREEYEKSTGRGSDESIADWIGRSSGIFTLYLSIIQTPLSSIVPTLPSPPTPDQLGVLIPPVLRFTAAWTWLAHALRDPLPALPPIAQLATVWIEILGAEAIKLWGKYQVGKVVAAIKKEGVDEGKVKGDSEASRLRLSLALNGWQDLKYPSSRDWE